MLTISQKFYQNLFLSTSKQFKIVSSVLVALVLLLGLGSFQKANAAVTVLADQPILTINSVPGNVLLVLSVEYPTAFSAANLPTGAYNSSTTYIGYFDSNKCYSYYNSTTDTNAPYFTPAVLATNHTCSGYWSGNFLNWAITPTIDPFRYVLSGGYRSIDTSTLTVLEKAYNGGTGASSSESPDSTTTSGVSGATPFSAWTTISVRTWSLGNAMYFTTGGSVDSPSGTIVPYDPSENTSINTAVGTKTASVKYNGTTYTLSKTTVYTMPVRVQVCSTTVSLEANCVQYGTNYKPQGLIQQYNQQMRFGVIGYLLDDSILRDGGILRGRMAFLGPTTPVVGSNPVTNPNPEWSATTGVYVTNPDPTDASGSPIAVSNSGVLNYLNKFGETSQQYKQYDPVGELYYTAIRYYKHLGNVSAYTTLTSGDTTAQKTTEEDGFPVITSWDDPILYGCQQNFIIGIGDVNTHADSNQPGNTMTSNASGNEPTIEPEVTADTTVNVSTATKQVGTLEGISNLQTTPIPWCCSDNNGYDMAGLAYDSHTVDMRPGQFLNSNGTKTSIQTVSTYWLDVQESQIFRPQNQFWLAAKYGGFYVPAGYQPYVNTTPLTMAQFDPQGTLDPTNTSSPYTADNALGKYKPDHYFSASQAQTMATGLQTAFASIASQISAPSSSFTTVSPYEQAVGDVIYGSSYNAGTWSGNVTATQVSFDGSGNILQTPAPVLEWNANTVITTQLGGTAWNTSRLVVTSTSATSAAGVPFRTANISSTELSALGSTSTIQSNILNYLRGDRSNEGTSGAGYRTRTYLLGDIVDSIPVAQGPPNATYSDSNNPGYSTFKNTYVNRQTIVYTGANDGMLHAINGGITSSGGQEIFAYVPSLTFGTSTTGATTGLAALTNDNFIHHNYVDGQIAVADIDFNKAGNPTGTGTPNWHTILIGGLGKGGMGYYAIDITNPTAATSETAMAKNVLWEFTDPNMGYTFGKPLIIKTAKYGWVVALSSGYDNADGVGRIYFVNPATGALLETVKTNAGTSTNPSGLAHLDAFIVDFTDYKADSIYGGDLLGNLWRLDVTGTSGSYPNPVAIATLTDTSGNVQPVTTNVLPDIDPLTYNRYIAVGTGQLLSQNDLSSTQVQTMYVIADGKSGFGGFSTSNPFPLTRSNLSSDTNYLLTGISSPSKYGYYVDLPVAANNVASRITVDPAETTGNLLFTASLPNGSACNPAGTNTIYLVSLASGVSELIGSNGSIEASQTFNGLATSNSIVNANGTLRIEVGTTDLTGSSPVTVNGGSCQLGSVNGIESACTTPLAGNSTKRLNWREVPTPN